MTLTITHKFVSPIADAGNATLVRPSNWNDSHTITAGSQTLLGNNSTAVAAVSDLSPAQVWAILYQSATVITVSTTPYTPGSSETVILYNRTANLALTTLNLSSASARNGAPLLVKDVAGNASLDFINCTPNGTETIDGLNPLSIRSDYGGFFLVPLSTWASGGWYVSP